MEILMSKPMDITESVLEVRGCGKATGLGLKYKNPVALSCTIFPGDELSLYGKEYTHFMDIKPHLDEASQQQARESLIGISYSSPSEILASDGTPDAINHSDTVSQTKTDEAEKYRSELISISYSQPPDVKASPLPNGAYHG